MEAVVMVKVMVVVVLGWGSGGGGLKVSRQQWFSLMLIDPPLLQFPYQLS
jgi:hypothetical protein